MHDLINNISYEFNATIAATLSADMPPRGGDVSRHGLRLTTAGEAGARSFILILEIILGCHVPIIHLSDLGIS